MFRPTCRQCQKLKKQWYQDLKNTGFEDAESGNILKTTKNSHFIRRDMMTFFQFEAKESYYLWAEQQLTIGEFKSLKDQMIWEYHADGVSSRKMSPIIGIESSWCRRKIQRIRGYLTCSSQSFAASY